MGLADITKGIEAIGKTIDDNIESGEERQQQLSSRHQIDMVSDSWLSKNIRPITLIFLMLCEALIIIAMIAGKPVDQCIVGQVGTLLFGAFGFSFHSRIVGMMLSDKARSSTPIETIM